MSVRGPVHANVLMQRVHQFPQSRNSPLLLNHGKSRYIPVSNLDITGVATLGPSVKPEDAREHFLAQAIHQLEIHLAVRPLYHSQTRRPYSAALLPPSPAAPPHPLS